jgi:predicted nucleic acid-binding protein
VGRIVSNTGPIIGLAKIEKLDLFKILGKEIIIPPYVYKELFGKIGPEAAQIEDALREFIRVMPINLLDPPRERSLVELDEGERQAILLARSLGKDTLLLMDDYAGRKAARDLKIGVTGLVGLLLLAKERGLVEKVTPLIEKIRMNGYWLSDEVMEVARRLAGE